MKFLKNFNGFINENLNEKEFSTEERIKLADKGFALPDGSFPIVTVDDLKNAVYAFGRANDEDRKKVAQHIAKRAKALGQADLIPQTEIFQKALKESLNEAKQEQIKYLQDFITRWDDAQEKDLDLKSLETEYNKKLAQFGLPKWSADELLHQLQSNTQLSKVNEDWGSSDQGTMNKAIHKDLGNPTKFMSPFDDKLRSAAGDAVDFWWDEWPEYKRDREGLVDNAIRAYYRAYFPKEFAGFTKMFNESLNEGYEVHFSDGVRQMKKFDSESKAVLFAKELIKNKKDLAFVDVFNAGPGFHSTADTNAVVAWWGDRSFMDNKSKNDPKLAAKKIDESLDEAISTYVYHVHPRDEHGDHIPSQRRVVKIKRANQSSAKDALIKQYPSSKFFSELDSIEESVNEDVYYDGDVPALTNIFMKILWIRDQAHIFHWQTKSYARHIAFGEFYEGFIDEVDGIAEGILKTNQVQFTSNASMMFVNYSEAEADLFVQKIRDFFINEFSKVILVEDNRGIHNLVDNVLSLIDSLQYKLTLENTQN